MAFLTIVGWVFAVVLGALVTLTALQRSHQSFTAAFGLGCALVVTLGLLGVIGAVLTVGVACLLALGVAGMVATTPLRHRVDSSHLTGTPDFGAELRGAWQCMLAALPAAVAAWRASGQRKAHPYDELAPRRGRKEAPAPPPMPGPERRHLAPAPALPAADAPGAPARPALAPAAGNIPPDHAAAHQRIASAEPEGLSEHVRFLISEGKALALYGDAFGAYADNLIHGPGVPPEALKATFDFADMFADVSQMAHLANKRVLDYFQGHMEWAETHEPTRDGHWTVRE